MPELQLHRGRTMRRAVLSLASLTAVVLLSGCVVVVVTAGPTTVTTGETVVYLLDLSAMGGDGETFYIIADVPPGWTLLSNQYQGTVGGMQVSGTAGMSGFSPCDDIPEQTGFQRIRLSAGPFPDPGLPTDTGQIELEFQVDDQPAGEYKIVFWFGAFGLGKGRCGAPAVRTINRDNPFLSWLESFTDGIGGVDGLDGAGGMDLDPTGGLLVVSSREDDALGVFGRDAATGLLTFLESEPFPVARMPDKGELLTDHRVHFSPDGQHLYVARLADESVSVFLATPGGIDHVASYDSGSFSDLQQLTDLAVLDDQVFALTTTRMVIFDRDVSTGELTFVTAIDSIEDIYQGLGITRRLAASPDGTGLFASASGFSGFVSVFSRDPVTDAVTFVETETEGGGGGPIRVSPDSRHLYDLGRVFAIDPGTGELDWRSDSSLVPVGTGNGRSLDFSADGLLMALRSFSTVVFARRNPESGALSPGAAEFSFDPPNGDLSGGLGVALSPDGRHVYTTSETLDVLGSFANELGVFTDGFESGDTTAWSVAVD